MQEVIEAARENKFNLNKYLRDLNQVQRNFQFRSRGKTSKKGNNGLDKKDWILKKSVDSFYSGLRRFSDGNWGLQLEMSSTLLSVIQKGSKIKSIILNQLY